MTSGIPVSLTLHTPCKYNHVIESHRWSAGVDYSTGQTYFAELEDHAPGRLCVLLRESSKAHRQSD